MRPVLTLPGAKPLGAPEAAESTASELRKILTKRMNDLEKTKLECSWTKLCGLRPPFGICCGRSSLKGI
jgi:hypothetical protein